MAEGGFEEYENPEFDRDDYDMTEEELRSLNESQQAIDLQIEDMQHQDRETLENTRKMVINEKLDRFIEYNERRGGGEPLKPAIGICSINKDKLLCIQDLGMKEAPLEYKRGGLTLPYALSSLEKTYGMAFIRDTLGFVDYKQPPKVSQTEITALAKVRDKVNTATEEIPMQDFSETSESRKTIDAVNEVDTSLQNMFELPEVANARTQTEGITFRELQSLDEALRRTRGELANNLAKLTDLDKDIAKERRKLNEAEDEISKRDVKARLKNLEDERGARLEAVSVNKEALRSQINRIKETIDKVLKEDTTLGERIRTLFREQGITIVSVLTAFGMIIGVIVEAFIPTTSGGATTPPPKDGSGVKDWIKKQLSNLGKLLANLARKAAAALPGIIGSIVSFLLSSVGKVANWFGNNLWAVAVLVAGLLYTAAMEYIKKSHK